MSLGYQQVRFTVLAAAPDGTDGVDHMPRFEPLTASDARLTSGTTHAWADLGQGAAKNVVTDPPEAS
jgi:hypothetical protein